MDVGRHLSALFIFMAIALVPGACRRRQAASVVPDAGGPVSRGDAAVLDAASSHDTGALDSSGASADVDVDPPYLFMLDERSIVLRESVLEEEEEEEAWLAGPPRRLGEFAAVRAVDMKRLPPDLAAWRGRKVQLMNDAGRTCVATVKSLRAAARIGLPIAADESSWSERSDRKVAQEIWKSFYARTRFEGVLAGACAGSTWARPANLPVPKIVPAKAPRAAVAKAVETAFRRLPAWIQFQADHAAFRKEHPSSELTAAGDPELAVVRAGGTELVEVRAHIQDEPGGCDKFEGAFWTLWQVTQERGRLAVVLRGGPNRGEEAPSLRMSGAVDLDGDGVPEILLKEGQGYVGRLRDKDPSSEYDDLSTIDLYHFYCN